jgi:hypothetical protein
MPEVASLHSRKNQFEFGMNKTPTHSQYKQIVTQQKNRCAATFQRFTNFDPVKLKSMH